MAVFPWRRGAALCCVLAVAAPCAARKAPPPPKLHEVCPRVGFLGKAVKLSAMEKELVCGDPHTDGWKKISLPEARQFMTAFLQSRGYQFPVFTAENEMLEVEIGTTTVVRKLTGTGLGGIYDLGKRRQVVGKLLTPSLLDDVKKAVVFELQSRGYACPVVAVIADARTGEVHVDAEPGPSYTLQGIIPARVAGVAPGVFDRYRSFQNGMLFDTRLLSLTSDRIKQDDLFLSAYYDVACSTSERLTITQRVVEGKPRSLDLGAGIDTEQGPVVKAQVKFSRIGKRASTANLSVYASRLEDSLDASMNLYLSDTSRLYLMPEATLQESDEIQYQEVHTRAAFMPAWSHDGTDFHIETRGGPAFEYYNTISGVGVSRSEWPDFVTRTTIMTHLYEYYESDPRRGWTATLETSSRFSGLDSPVTEHRLAAQGESLWNLGNFDPPAFVLATRGLLGTVSVQGNPALAFAETPPTDRFFLGGDASIRGFPLQELPDNAGGFMTAAYDGVELRAGDLLPANLQPLVFIDAAMGGLRGFHLDPSVYYSPGVGMQWSPSFGTLRATAGRGLTWAHPGPTPAPPPHLQFFFSFGEQF